MIRRAVVGLGVLLVLVVGAPWTYARIDESCFDRGAPLAVDAGPGTLSVGARAYNFRPSANADYGAYIFPGGLLRGHAVTAGVSIRSGDNGSLPEIRPLCVRVRHASETIERRAIVGASTDRRPDGTAVVTLGAYAKGSLPEWRPGDVVRIWLLSSIGDEEYLVDLGETPIASVG